MQAAFGDSQKEGYARIKYELRSWRALCKPPSATHNEKDTHAIKVRFAKACAMQAAFGDSQKEGYARIKDELRSWRALCKPPSATHNKWTRNLGRGILQGMFCERRTQ